MFVIALTAISGLFYACSDEELNDVSSPETDFTVRAKNGYLEFKDQATFDKIQASLENQDDEALDAWESQFRGFTSLRSMEAQAMDAQEAYFEKLRNMTEVERKALSQSDENFWYSEYLKERTSLFVLKDSGQYYLNASLASSNLVDFLNQDGVYKVGDEIRMYGDNFLKIIRDGDDSKIEKLSTIDVTDEKLGMYVYNRIVKPFKDSGSENSRQAINVVSGRTTKCSDKSNTNDKSVVSGDAFIDYREIPFSGGVYTTNLLVQATQWYKDGIFGGYTRKRTSALRIEINVSLYDNGVFISRSSGTATTNGNLKAQLKVAIDLGNAVFASQRNDARVAGTVNVYGRDNTLCGDAAPDPDNRWHY